MKVLFENSNGCPSDVKTFKDMEGGYYDSFISTLEEQIPDKNVTLLSIGDLDRGVKNWQQFGNILMEKFPNLKGLAFDMNYYYNGQKNDEWKTAETFFVQMGLDYLEIEWAQLFKGHVTNTESTSDYTVDFHIGEEDDPSDYESIKEEISNEVRESGPNYNIYITPSPECWSCEKECSENYCQECIHNIQSLEHKIITEKCGHMVVACCRTGDIDCVESPENCVLCKRNIHPSEYYNALQENTDYQQALQILLDIDPDGDIGCDNEYDYLYCSWCI